MSTTDYSPSTRIEQALCTCSDQDIRILAEALQQLGIDESGFKGFIRRSPRETVNTIHDMLIDMFATSSRDAKEHHARQIAALID